MTQLLGLGSATLGVAGLVASAKVYADTQRPFWRLPSTLTRFFCTTSCAGFLVSPAPWLAVVPLVLLIGMEASIVFEPDRIDQRSSALMRGPLRTTTCLRVVVALLFFVVAVSSEPGAPWIALSLLALTEFCARSLFFRAVDEPKMPGIG